MSAPFSLSQVLMAMFVSQHWACCAARWEKATAPDCKRLSLYARTQAVVEHDRVLNGRTE